MAPRKVKGKSVWDVCLRIVEAAIAKKLGGLASDYQKKQKLADLTFWEMKDELLDRLAFEIEVVPDLNCFRWAPTCYMTGMTIFDLSLSNAFPIPASEALAAVARPLSLDHILPLDARREGDTVCFVRNVSDNIGFTTWEWNRAKSAWPPVLVYLLAVLSTRTMAPPVAARICNIVAVFWDAWEIGHAPDTETTMITVQQWYRCMRMHDRFASALNIRFKTPIRPVWERLDFESEDQSDEWMRDHYPSPVATTDLGSRSRFGISTHKYPSALDREVREYQELTKRFLSHCKSHYGGVQYHLSTDGVISFTGDTRQQARLQLEAMRRSRNRRDSYTSGLIVIFNALHLHAWTMSRRIETPSMIWMSDIDSPNLFFHFMGRPWSPLLLSRSRIDHSSIIIAEKDRRDLRPNYDFGYVQQQTYSYDDIIEGWDVSRCNVKANALITNLALGEGFEAETQLCLERYRQQANSLLKDELPWFLEENPEPGRQRLLDLAMQAANRSA